MRAYYTIVHIVNVIEICAVDEQYKYYTLISL